MEEKSAFENFELHIGDDIKDLLMQIASWSYYLSIIGFIGLGFLIIGGGYYSFASNDALSSDAAYTLGYSMGSFIPFLLMVLIYLFPILYLFKFSKQMKIALRSGDNSTLKTSLKNLKSHYKYIGILSIIILGIYVIAFFIGIATTLFNVI